MRRLRSKYTELLTAAMDDGGTEAASTVNTVAWICLGGIMNIFPEGTEITLLLGCAGMPFEAQFREIVHRRSVGYPYCSASPFMPHAVSEEIEAISEPDS